MPVHSLDPRAHAALRSKRDTMKVANMGNEPETREIVREGDPAGARPPIYCRQCGYELVGLSEPRCPECGQPFDPDNSRTFQRHPRGWLLRWWLRRAAWAMMVLVVATVLSLAVTMMVLHSRWKAQEKAVAAIRQAGGRVSIVRSRSDLLVGLFGFRTNVAFDNGPAQYRQGLLGKRFAYLTDRAVHVQLFGGPIATDSDAWQDMAIDDAWLAKLVDLPYAEVLEIASPHVTDTGLDCLRHVTSLHHVALRCPKLSRAAVEQLGHDLHSPAVLQLRQPRPSPVATDPSLGQWRKANEHE